MKNQNNNLNSIRCSEDKEKEAKKLYNILFKKAMSRRMAATKLGYADMTYMVTQNISDWLNDGRAQVIGVIKCERSHRFVEKITTNPKLFIKQYSNQLTMF